jgi:GT2 family glycosyltransferase/tetratricopeptide (TPR) repeat protein
VVPSEPWLEQMPPSGEELASIIILCCNELEYTRLCLESVLRHTRRPYELVLVDNGSTDGTREYLEKFRDAVTFHPDGELLSGQPNDPRLKAGGLQGLPETGRSSGQPNDPRLKAGGFQDLAETGRSSGQPNDPRLKAGGFQDQQQSAESSGQPNHPRLKAGGLNGPDRVVIVGNEKNLGFPAGVNQGLARARGCYLVLLNNDTIVTPQWLERLITLSLHDWPKVGLVGAVTNYAAAPQQVPVSYRSLEEIDGFAERRWREYGHLAVGTPRLIGFCVLIRREVVEKIGRLDERFGLGFFDDDDLGLRARQAGFRLAIAQGVFIHHFGSRTFRGLGIDPYRLLEENLERFRQKWGDEHCAGYRLPERIADKVTGWQGDKVSGACGARSAEAPMDDVHSGQIAPYCRIIVSPPPDPLGRPREKPVKRAGRLSVCMIVKNEEENLPGCLASVADLADEMNVVDTGSTDRTKEVAVQAGARVFDFNWVDSFAEARNASLRHATGDWVLWLDADERLDEDNRRKLGTLLAGLNGENLAFSMRQRSRLEYGPDAHAHVDQVRLFRNHPGLSWQHRVHEQILPDLRRFGAELRPTDIVIQHGGFADPARQAGKVQRNRRLLELELAERPDDAFVLYNLGAICVTEGRHREAIDLLERSRAGLNGSDGLLHKVYVLLTRAHDQARSGRALEVCRAGRQQFPRDPELLFWEGLLLMDAGDLGAAESVLLKVLQMPAESNFASVDAGLQGYRTRHVLAGIYRRQGRVAEAEAQWRCAVAEVPQYTEAWLNLGEMYLDQRRWPELEEAAGRVALDGRVAEEASMLRARGHLARRQFAPARQLLEETIGRAPKNLRARQVLTHVLLQEGSDLEAAEGALREVLALDPDHREARHNLEVLLERAGMRDQRSDGKGSGIRDQGSGVTRQEAEAAGRASSWFGGGVVVHDRQE